MGLLTPRRGAHYATTSHLRAAMPFQASSGLGGRGVYLGRDAAGAAFCFDAFDLYERGLLTGPAMVVLGEIGRGKSAFVKAYLHRQCGVFGRYAVVVSPKRGEYDRLAAAFGVEPIRLRPGGGVILNPLQSRDGDEAVELRALRGVAAACLARPLAPAEDAALAQALRAVRRTTATPTLPLVVQVLLDPPAEAWADRWQGRDHWLTESREAALALDRLCDGDAAGMFDGETSADVSLDAPLVVLDLSAVAESSAIAILMTAAMGWVQAQIGEETDAAHRKRILVVDEAWRVLANLAAAEALVDTVKHSRAYGIQTITVTHRIGDLAAAGDEGTRVSRIAEGLLSDAETKVIFAQPPDQLALARDRLGLTTTECEILPQLARGEALWKVGTRSFLVLHRLSDRETLICDTDARMVRNHRGFPRSQADSSGTGGSSP
jgi:type IV secretory pathway VirB4 component